MNIVDRLRFKNQASELGDNLCAEAASEIERLTVIEACAFALVEKIREHGTHDNWKPLADALANEPDADIGPA